MLITSSSFWRERERKKKMDQEEKLTLSFGSLFVASFLSSFLLRFSDAEARREGEQVDFFVLRAVGANGSSATSSARAWRTWPADRLGLSGWRRRRRDCLRGRAWQR